MKRKIIKLGQATYVMSLPSSWIRENKLGKGDYIDLQDEDGVLTLRLQQHQRGQTLILDISKLNDKLVKGYLEEAYALGYDTIELIHQAVLEPYSYHLKIKTRKKTTEFLQEIVNQKFINMEIVEQSDKRTVIKDLGGGLNEEAAHNIFNRIMFLLSQQAQETFNALLKHDVEKLQALTPSSLNIRKFILYYSRMLSILPLPKIEVRVKTNIMNHFNTINSTYRSIIRLSLGEKEWGYSKNALQVLKLITDQLQEMKAICLEFSQEKALHFLEQREKVWDEGYAQKGTVKDLALYWNFGALMASSWFVVREMYGLELGKLH